MDLWRQLGVEDEISHKLISKYELDQNEPPLKVLLEYARLAGVHMEDIADDESDLPEKLPGNYRHEGNRSKAASRRKPKR
jgi:transcriptional regulator with XRE-family HTH domain